MNKGFDTEDIARQKAATDFPDTYIYIIESRGQFYVETHEQGGGFTRTWERGVFSGLGKKALKKGKK